MSSEACPFVQDSLQKCRALHSEPSAAWLPPASASRGAAPLPPALPSAGIGIAQLPLTGVWQSVSGPGPVFGGTNQTAKVSASGNLRYHKLYCRDAS